MTRYSSAYRMTVTDRNSPEVKALKEAVREHNRLNPGKKQRVMAFGRLGPDNPNAHKYRGGAGSAQYIKVEDAHHFDIYVQAVSVDWRKDERSYLTEVLERAAAEARARADRSASRIRTLRLSVIDAVECYADGATTDGHRKELKAEAVRQVLLLLGSSPLVR